MEPEGPLELGVAGDGTGISRTRRPQALPPAFNLFWAGQGLSALGDAMTRVAMPLVVLAATGSVKQMGRLTALALVGTILSTAGAGFIVDRWEPRRIMIACDVLRFVLMSLIPLAWLAGLRSMALVYVVGISAALAEGLFYIGHVWVVARLVGRAQVGRANSRVHGTQALAFVVGPFLAGILSARFGPTLALGIDAATFFVSALSLAWIRTGPAEPRPPEARESTLGGLLVGVRFIRGNAELLRLILAMGAYTFFTECIVDIFIFRLKHELGLGDARVGVAFGIASAASALMAAATPWLRARASFHALWSATLVLQGVLLVATAAESPPFAVMVMAATLYVAPLTMLRICQASIRQEVAPEHLLGRVTSAYITLYVLPGPIGTTLATALAARFGARPIQAGIGLALIATMLVALLLGRAVRPRIAPR
jgi:MFS family permease